MELILERVPTGFADAPAPRHFVPAAPAFRDVEVILPTDLAAFGPVRATACGPAGAPAIVMLGGISGNRFVARTADGGPGWWRGLAGPGCAIDPARHCVVGLDFAADATGAAAPTTADQARVLAAALDALGIPKAAAILGASYGGMVALALAEIAPERVGRLVIISADAEPHPAATAGRELQRRVVALGLDSGRGGVALAIARGMAMMSYRTSDEFAARFEGGIEGACPRTCSEPGTYLRARGEDFMSVMTPERFLSLSASIDRHRVDPMKIATPALLIGAETDQLVPAGRMCALAAALAGPAQLRLLPCLYGHDMFLKEAENVGRLVAPFLAA
ncbi:MAG TPA: homoserine O-succinyltransferase [Allosphingosinicella sp.]|jgi:homoserine O-acetyltransferase